MGLNTQLNTYIGMTLDAKLQWKEHIKKKREYQVQENVLVAWTLSCQSTINSHYTSKLYVQFGVWYPALGLR
jgi:hypothetical protein